MNAGAAELLRVQPPWKEARPLWRSLWRPLTQGAESLVGGYPQVTQGATSLLEGAQALEAGAAQVQAGMESAAAGLASSAAASEQVLQGLYGLKASMEEAGQDGSAYDPLISALEASLAGQRAVAGSLASGGRAEPGGGSGHWRRGRANRWARRPWSKGCKACPTAPRACMAASREGYTGSQGAAPG